MNATGTTARAIRIVVVDETGMSISRDEDALVITGDGAALAVFADNLGTFAGAPAWGDHIHIEHYDGHPQIRAGSLPAVISATDAG